MKVFFNPHQSCQAAVGFSPSAAKPEKAVADWLKHGLVKESDIISFSPLEDFEIAYAHSPMHVARVLTAQADNGFNNRSKDVAASLPFTSGSMVAAAFHALDTGEHVCSPTSGFHHAGYDFSGGYCTFNGLMVAAVMLHKNGIAEKIGILDCDAHYGNGTADIIKRRNAFYVKHHTFGAHFIDRGDCDAGAFERWLTSAIADLQDCDIILYQAGADPHVRDPLGGHLTTEQMRLRDRQVFQSFNGKPLLWNLAGGYQRDAAGSIEPVLALHRTTVQECIAAQQKESV